MITVFDSPTIPLKLRVRVNNTVMTFIPEWVSFQNEVRTAFTWYNRTAQPKVFSLAWFSCQIGCTCAIRPRLLDLQFSLRNEVRFQFTWCQNEISYQDENLIRMKTGMKSFRNDLYWFGVRCHVNNYREIHGDGMNSFQNESHFGIMSMAPYPFIHFEITHFLEIISCAYSVLLVVLQIRRNFCVFQVSFSLSTHGLVPPLPPPPPPMLTWKTSK